MLSVREVAPDDESAHRLREAMWAEMGARYGELPTDARLKPDGLIVSLVGEAGGEDVGTVAVRWHRMPNGPPAAEIKRLYVVPSRRREGFSRVLMGAAESAARRAGATRIVLETGTEQPEAIALYRAIGYHPIKPYGEYSHDERSRCFAKELPTRVVVINGTIGAGKTTVASAMGDVLGERGSRCAWIDADALCQAEPRDPDDPYRQTLMFDALAGAAPAFRRAGLGLIVVARVIEDPADRDRYAGAFRCDAGPAELSVVRLVAPEAERLARVAAREPEGKWRDWGLARTVELEASLDALDLDDASVANVGRDPRDTAVAVIEAIGW